ncbi:ABC transporter ATP-binding protein [Rhizobium sp. YIM 134829]|uniref:ABC transporter ATP-binding protein n=1 Tax=Rhizobium sp. YIM 134829 TaxID=3390453 RepID=UPI00397DC712
MLSLSIENLIVRFPDLATPALDIARFEIAAGTRLAITGASGSGKSTFVNAITGLERPTAGAVAWDGVDIAALGEAARDRWRASHVGLVLQDFHLFPGLTAIDNILLPARLARADRGLQPRARDLMERVGLSRPEQKVETLSRGEMQRVAVARALLRRPGVLIADEPTASLDEASAAAVGDLLIDLAVAESATLIVVSHDQRLTARLDRALALAGGHIQSDQPILREARP